MNDNQSNHSSSITDLRWRNICKIAAVATLMQLIWILILLIITLSLDIESGSTALGSQPTSAEEYFDILQNERLKGIFQLDFLTLIMVILSLFTSFGIYAVLREDNEVYARITVIFILMGTILCIATDPSLSLIHLSDKYAEATTDPERNQILAAGDAVIASNTWNSTAGYIAGICLQGSFVFISFPMFKSKKFNNITIYMGILANGLDLIQHLLHIFSPSASVIILMIASPFYFIWYIMLGRDLFKSAKEINNLDKILIN